MVIAIVFIIIIEGIISMAKTTFNYNAGDKDMVSFRGKLQQT